MWLMWLAGMIQDMQSQERIQTPFLASPMTTMMRPLTNWALLRTINSNIKNNSNGISTSISNQTFWLLVEDLLTMKVTRWRRMRSTLHRELWTEVRAGMRQLMVLRLTAVRTKTTDSGMTPLTYLG